MSIVHHPDDATLMSFAAGSLTEALAAIRSDALASGRLTGLFSSG